MIEATIAMVLLAIAAAGILLPFAGAASVQTEAARQTLAANLATELMEKVLSESDILLNYEGYAEAEGAMRDAESNLLTDSIYDGFSRSVVSEAVKVRSADLARVIPVDLVRVTVSVDYQGNEMTRLTTLVGE